jgi:hypothetical protein
MEQPAINDHLVRRYILGELPERERERLEVGLLADDRYYETLTALEDEIEDELIDQYLDGELTHEEREKFERAFLNTPARAHKLKVIRDLKDHSIVSGLRESHVKKNLKSDRDYGQWLPAIAIFQNPLFGFSSAAALILALLCCVWLWMRANSLEAQLSQARAENPMDSGPRDRVEQLEMEKQKLMTELRLSEEKWRKAEEQLVTLRGQDVLNPPRPPDKEPGLERRPFYASLTLSSGLRSGSGKGNTLTLRPHHTEARLTIDVDRVDPNDYKRVRAVVKKQAGAEVWSSDNVNLQRRGQDARVLLKVPVERLAEDGLYVAELVDDQSGPIGLYTFRVIRK